MDLKFSISEKLALKLLNIKFKNMLKFVNFRDGTIEIGIYLMLSTIKIELKILQIEPKEGVTIEFVGSGAKSFMVKKVISAFYEKAHLQKTEKENVYKYSWKDSLDFLGEYKDIVINAKKVKTLSENGQFDIEIDVL